MELKSISHFCYLTNPRNHVSSFAIVVVSFYSSGLVFRILSNAGSEKRVALALSLLGVEGTWRLTEEIALGRYVNEIVDINIDHGFLVGCSRFIGRGIRVLEMLDNFLRCF